MYPLTEMLLKDNQERRVVVGARQSGRTTALLISAILTAMENRSRVVAFVCPNYAMMQYAIHSAKELFQGSTFEIQDDTIYVGGGSLVRFYCANELHRHHAYLGFTDFYLDNYEWFTKDQRWMIEHIIEENDTQQVTEAIEG